MNIKSFLALSFFQKKIFLCDKEKYNYSIMKIISLLLNPINYKKSEFMKKIYFLPRYVCLRHFRCREKILSRITLMVNGEAMQATKGCNLPVGMPFRAVFPARSPVR